MRKILLLPLVLWACGGAKEAPPAEAPAATPAALTAADVVGSYTGTTMANGTDSVLSTWTSVGMTNAAGGLEGKLVLCPELPSQRNRVPPQREPGPIEVDSGKRIEGDRES